MRTFTYSVMRTSYAWRDIEIKAANATEAYVIALETCGDYEYNEKDADYSIERVFEQGETA